MNPFDEGVPLPQLDRDRRIADAIPKLQHIVVAAVLQADELELLPVLVGVAAPALAGLHFFDLFLNVVSFSAAFASMRADAAAHRPLSFDRRA
jgi:hypothetical protein